ncbi:hypothetical protein FRZ67_08805 [Panacibacter ginsenosidivorans]|uniref:Outer membrane protein beta-barrel domain-containing protein n=1 Tax=Panacibacter ginsenosidivorans TaxID=1813871 RepID=A0A5B8V968_9BACT|nr:hypothetical protein [Panacibacter ginsenosidivorans]QEC67391.1 hypothetical protein FRZ67_08805 [Panacibacter ginsenosidivorans]
MTPFAKKQLLILLAGCFACFVPGKLRAQKLFFLYAHGLYANPVDKNFKDNNKYGVGVEGGAAVGWGKTFIVGTVGYTSFSNSDKNTAGKTSYVPLKVGLRQYVFSKFIYLHGDVGAGKIKNDLYDYSAFSGDIGVGIKLTAFEVQLDYDGFTRKSPEPSGYASWIGIKAGFNLGL